MNIPPSAPDCWGLSVSSWAQICAVLSRYPEIQQALLYGSRAKGSHQPGSDIDLCLQGALSDSDLLRLLNALDDLLLPYTLDICRFEALDPAADASLIAHIQRVGQVFYAGSQTNQTKR